MFGGAFFGQTYFGGAPEDQDISPPPGISGYTDPSPVAGIVAPSQTTGIVAG
jgi:hypothetical protein